MLYGFFIVNLTIASAQLNLDSLLTPTKSVNHEYGRKLAFGQKRKEIPNVMY